MHVARRITRIPACDVLPEPFVQVPPESNSVIGGNKCGMNTGDITHETKACAGRAGPAVEQNKGRRCANDAW